MDKTPKELVDELREFIKYKASLKGMTLTQLLAKISEVYPTRKPDVNNYSGKIRRGTLSIIEVFEICDILDLKFKFVDED